MSTLHFKRAKQAPKPTQLLFSVTIDDCIVQVFCSGGSGGQNQNRIYSGVRIIHEPSGARGEARDSRDQLRNKRAAFVRMAHSREFQIWHHRETARRLFGTAADTPPIKILGGNNNIRKETRRSRTAAADQNPHWQNGELKIEICQIDRATGLPVSAWREVDFREETEDCRRDPHASPGLCFPRVGRLKTSREKN